MCGDDRGNLSQITGKAGLSQFYEDGIFDIFLGLMLGTMAFGIVVEDWAESEIAGILTMLGVAVVAVVSLLIVRRRLLRSRLGEFKPGPIRRRRIALVRLALLGSVVIGLILGWLVAAGGVSIVSLEVLMPLVWFINAVVAFSAMAYYSDVPRFYLYGFLFGSAMPLMIWPDVLWDYSLPPWAALGAPAAILVAIGLYKLSGFLRDYPEQAPTNSIHA